MPSPIPTEPRPGPDYVVAPARAADKVAVSLITAFDVSYDMPGDMHAMLEQLNAVQFRQN